MPLLKQAHGESAEGEKKMGDRLYRRTHNSTCNSRNNASSSDNRGSWETPITQTGAPRRPRRAKKKRQPASSRTGTATTPRLAHRPRLPRRRPPTTRAQTPRTAPRRLLLPHRPARSDTAPLLPVAARRRLGALTGHTAENRCRGTAHTAGTRRTRVEASRAQRAVRGHVFRRLCPQGAPLVTP